ncbi:hypothetical protein MIMGU_mgv1a018705mg [Erythranthe guttata]|uniref:Ubiquitin-like domain-containing protein n=1 Tax=Erythranthe guttata TaxID=4155 RepID=A0A022RGH4_ERYGU|nr:hypothetical protein MIMGU_mgv1a018705mg [Erythranthe guttata]
MAKVKEEKTEIVVHIKYNESGGEEKYSFDTHMNIPLRRIFLDFCDRLGLVYSSIAFTFDGARIRETQTPRDLGLENDDLIDAFNHQIGD